jgi:hypothetical protein
MRKLFEIMVLVVLGLFLSVQVTAREINFGIKAGMAIANIYGDDVNNPGWRTGVAGGVFMDYSINSIFILHPEVLIAMKGAKPEADLEGVRISETTKLDYIDIPLLAKIRIPVDGNITPGVFAGPYMGFNIKADVETSMDGETGEEDIKDYVKTVDFGLVLGGFVDYQLEDRGIVTIGARYAAGLTTIDEPEDDKDKEMVGKNQAFMIMLGYTF